MNITINFKQMPSSDAIKDYAEKKSQKFTKFFQGTFEVKWTFKVEGLKHIAHVHLVGSHMDDNVSVDSENMYESIDTASDKILGMLRKDKEKLRSHHSS